jgi:hypothetical protein
MIDVIQIGPYLRAQPPFSDGMIGITVELDRSAVPDLRGYATSIGAVVRTGATNK